MYDNPKLLLDPTNLPSGRIGWQSPSNIAIIKYWGKHGEQLPRNASFSLTLDQAHTQTGIEYGPRVGEQLQKEISLDFMFHGEARPDFAAKLEKYLTRLLPIFPFIKQLHLRIYSENSFPHSSGIASSASSMSAIALALCDMERQLFGLLTDQAAFLQKASFIARLGSGSASRSVYAYSAIWGKNGEVTGSSDLFAVPMINELHETFKTFHDDILLVSRAEKAVSSRAGHSLMEGNPYADVRYQQARKRFHRLLAALKSGDVEDFGKICEAEALTLHALMMTSMPPYLLMMPNTLEVLHRVKSFRESSGQPLYFTLDAGPNVHLLYPDAAAAPIQEFIETELKPFCQDGQMIRDVVGMGPQRLEV